MKVRLTREDLVNLANQGLAYIEQQASEASGVAPEPKCRFIVSSRNYGGKMRVVIRLKQLDITPASIKTLKTERLPMWHATEQRADTDTTSQLLQ